MYQRDADWSGFFIFFSLQNCIHCLSWLSICQFRVFIDIFEQASNSVFDTSTKVNV